MQQHTPTPQPTEQPAPSPDRIERAIRHWEGIIAGDGLTRAALLFAAMELQKALRARSIADRPIADNRKDMTAIEG
jgi:hypothetical protein